MINRDKIKLAVEKAVNQLPTKALLYKPIKDDYHVTSSYESICELTGVLYTDDNTSKNITYSDPGISYNYPSKKFITVYNENIKEGYLLVTDKVYEIVYPGENMKIYNDIALKETEEVIK